MSSGPTAGSAPYNDIAFYKELLNHIGDGVYFVDRDRRILYWNKGAERLTGFTEQEIVGRTCDQETLNHVDADGRPVCRGGCLLHRCMEEGKEQQGHLFLHNKAGRRLPVKVRVQPMMDAQGWVVGAVEIFTDASGEYEMRRKADAMQRMAFLDHLTQLPNRRYLELSLQALLNEPARSGEIGVLMMDLDGLKAINDQYGHSAGDQALCEAGRTLAGALRPSDVVGRWGGDEYVAIVNGVDERILGELARRCVMLTERKRMKCQEQEFQLSISAGATLVRSGDQMETLIARADEMLYRSKSQGGCRATMN
jgi:diguanylate cyclase (GGDEF)-like protein/PAS domain S-box-containing protein